MLTQSVVPNVNTHVITIFNVIIGNIGTIILIQKFAKTTLNKHLNMFIH